MASPRSRPRISISALSHRSESDEEEVPLTWALDAAVSFEMEPEPRSTTPSRGGALVAELSKARKRATQRRAVRPTSPARELRAKHSSPYGQRSAHTSQANSFDPPARLPSNPALTPPAEPSPPPDRTAYNQYLPSPATIADDAACSAALPAGEQQERSVPLTALQQLQASASNSWQSMLRTPTHTRVHCEALVTTIGAPASFDALDEAEQRRRVHIFTRFLNSVSLTEDQTEESLQPRGKAKSEAFPPKEHVEDNDPTAGDDEIGVTASSTPRATVKGADAEVVAESLAACFRKIDVLASLSTMTHKGGYDGQLALSCLANLARLGLVDALCRHGKVRGAVVGAMLAARNDEALAAYALPCAFNMSGHPLFLRSLRHTPRIADVLLRWLHDDDAADILTPGGSRARQRSKGKAARRNQRLPGYFADAEFEAVMGRCASTLLQNMRAAKRARRASIVVLREDAKPGFPYTASAPTRLAAWLVGWRPSSSLGKASTAPGQASRRQPNGTCIEV